ncbi:MAG TPA: hypothetical protein PKU71_15975 [bacterium]|nr:hypothetical protein [bacterium]
MLLFFVAILCRLAIQVCKTMVTLKCRDAYSDLIGKQRAYEIIVNAIIPYVALYAQRRGDKQLHDTVMTCMKTWASYEHNHIIGWMRKRLPGMPDRVNAEYAQGLIELHKKCRVRNCSDCRIFQRMVYSDFI